MNPEAPISKKMFLWCFFTSMVFISGIVLKDSIFKTSKLSFCANTTPQTVYMRFEQLNLVFNPSTDKKVVTCLSHAMSFYDRHLAYIIITKNYKEKRGLTTILQRYSVSNLIMDESTLADMDTQLLELIRKKNIHMITLEPSLVVPLQTDSNLSFIYGKTSVQKTTLSLLAIKIYQRQKEVILVSEIYKTSAENIVDTLSLDLGKKQQIYLLALPARGLSYDVFTEFIELAEPPHLVINSGSSLSSPSAVKKGMDFLKANNTKVHQVEQNDLEISFTPKEWNEFP